MDPLRDEPNLLLTCTRKAYRAAQKWTFKPKNQTVLLDKVLMGGEVGYSAERYAKLVGEPMRPSTPISQSPHVRFLRDYAQLGERILEPEFFKQTTYYKNALRAISVHGSYFYAKDDDQILTIARDFIARFNGQAPSEHVLKNGSGHTKAGKPIVVRPIAYSDCFEVIDGNHRLAMSVVRGKTSEDVSVEGLPALTPLQRLLFDVMWQNGRLELYQPIDAPELSARWKLVRGCKDRHQKALAFLRDQGLTSAGASYLDIGSNYGWFVAQMKANGFKAHGIERDPTAIEVGRVAYGLDESHISQGDIPRLLRESTQMHDVVSCYSVLHHFVLGKGAVPAEELIRLIDKVTGRVLLFDTGQSHEEWFKEPLKEWTADYVESWILRNTNFTHAHRLGVDSDAKPPYEGNYARTLFAFTR